MECKTVFICIIGIYSIACSASSLCPCEDVTLCQTVNRTGGDEVYAFVLQSNRSVWSMFNWTKLTTVALAGFYDPELMCYAHKNHVRVVTLVDYPVTDLLDDDKISKWIALQIQYASDRFLDGVNIDIEEPIDRNSPLFDALTRFTYRVTDSFHKAIPGSQVTFDVPWSPYNVKNTGIDGRNYNFTELAKATDFLIIMSYDIQSQIFDDECTARANSPLFDSAGGAMAYMRLGIERKKLVLALPWYGYLYNCTRTGPQSACFIKEVPFRGVNCSDAAGKQLDYRDIAAIENVFGSRFDEHSESYFIQFKDSSNISHHIWFDKSWSLQMKISFAIENALRGVGMWNANTLDYSGSAQSLAQIKAMWDTLPYFKKSI